MRFVWRFFQLFLIVCITAYSCKGDEEWPVVTILENTTSGNLQYGDSLELFATLQKAEGLSSATLQKNGVDVFSARTIKEVESGKFYILFVFDDRYLDEGGYQIKVTAKNGANIASDFFNFNYNGLDKKLEGVTVLTDEKLEYYDFENTQTLNLSNYFKIGTSGFYQSLIAIPADGSLVKGISLPNLTIGFNKSFTTSATFNKVRGVVESGKQLYFFKQDGTVLQVDSTGNIINQITLPEGDDPVSIDIFEDRLFVASNVNMTGIFELRVLNMNSGSVQRSTFFADSPVRVVAVTKNLLYVSANSGDGAVLYRYRPDENLLTKIFTIEGEAMVDMVSISGESVVFSTNQTIQSYNIPNGNMPQLRFNFGAQCLRYDDTNGHVYIGSGNMVQRFSLSGPLQYVYGSISEVLDISLKYNK